ncbi:hypothetical protein [Ferribacterium limneticum]|uniref:hypothetical protein n=1 Tax=Ferribacterium limneticum TaxID=76259 RepID=UPI001CF8970A|nr:hypothetical protein [Ferribacterium limneticum]UCV23686.1 hypothetical protein KI613_03870 [Ferribacterium limneticum]
MTSSVIIDSMALVSTGKASITSQKALDKIHQVFVADLVCRHCWGPNWKQRLSEMASNSNSPQLISFTDFSRATMIQRTLGRQLAAADCATLALAEEKGWVVVAGCKHVLMAAKQLQLKHISVV